MAQNEIWTCWEEILEKIKIFEKSISSQIFTVNMTIFTMKLKIHMQRIKSFLPPSLVFYPNFFHVKYRQKLQKLIFQKFTWPSLSKKWGKKLVRGGAQKIIYKCVKLAEINLFHSNEKNPDKAATTVVYFSYPPHTHTSTDICCTGESSGGGGN